MKNLKLRLTEGELITFINESEFAMIELSFGKTLGGAEMFKIFMNGKFIQMSKTFKPFENKLNKLIQEHDLTEEIEEEEELILTEANVEFCKTEETETETETETERCAELRELTLICVERMNRFLKSAKNVKIDFFNRPRLIESFKVDGAEIFELQSDESDLEHLHFIFDDSTDEDVLQLEKIIEKWTVKGVKINENCWNMINVNIKKRMLTICIDGLLDEIQEKQEKDLKSKEEISKTLKKSATEAKKDAGELNDSLNELKEKAGELNASKDLESKIEARFIVVGIKADDSEGKFQDEELTFVKLIDVPDFKTEAEATDFLNTMNNNGGLRNMNEFDFVEIKKVFVKVLIEE